ncbi:MAG TPA: N-acetylmuramoyl-L-alanine amidase [Candidatus Wallbacteria bacterium]|nr:N-acetylmuramoyl-L-alanine amidase [Candidatus Wallbacteria bacterium]
MVYTDLGWPEKAGKYNFLLFIALTAIALFLLFSGVSRAEIKYVLSSHKVNFTSDSVRLNFYFNETVEAKNAYSKDPLKYIVDFEYCGMSAGEIVERLNDPLIEKFRVYKSGDKLVVEVDQIVNTQVRVLRGRDKGKNKFYISIVFYRPYESYFKYQQRLIEIDRYKKSHIPIVVIDPGHGGKDSGARIGSGDHEKDQNFKFARKIADYINETGLCRAYLTRNGDHFLALSRRVYTANQYSADAFISIHFNSNRSKNVRGFEAYYLSSEKASDTSAQIIAKIENSSGDLDESITGEEDLQVQSILIDLKEKENIKESGILSEIITRNIHDMKAYPAAPPKQANFAVLRSLNMPSVLLELGYLSNSRDVSFLNSRENFEELSSRIAIGIISFLCDNGDNKIPENGRSHASVEPKTGRIADEISEEEKTEKKAAVKKITQEVFKTYTIKSGDTLSKIARRLKITLSALLKANPGYSKTSSIHPGETLKIPYAR